MKRLYVLLLCFAVGQLCAMRQKFQVQGLSYRLAKHIEDDIFEIENFFYKHRMLYRPVDENNKPVQMYVDDKGVEKYSPELLLKKLDPIFARLIKKTQHVLFIYDARDQNWKKLSDFIAKLKLFIKNNDIDSFDKIRNGIIIMITPTLQQPGYFAALKNYFLGQKAEKLPVEMAQPAEGPSAGYMARLVNYMKSSWNSMYQWMFPTKMSSTTYSVGPGQKGSVVVTEKTSETISVPQEKTMGIN